jgi:predicted DNA-binding transcriptional regulator YafY
MMPEKKDPYAGPGQKMIGLFGLLLFSGRAHSLAQLADAFQCSKQTILRMLDEVGRSHWLSIDTWVDGKRRRWYQARTPKKLPDVSLDADALGQLMLCRDMVWHLLPETYRTSTSRTLQGATVLLPQFDDRAEALDSYVRTKPKGMIDYSGKADIISKLTRAIREHTLCTITYKGPTHPRARRYTVAPYQLIIFHEGIYVRCRTKSALEKPGSDPDKTLAIHRIIGVEVLPEGFSHIHEETHGVRTAGPFGLHWEEPFQVSVRIVAKAAQYVRERIWSDDQTITPQPDGGIILTFTSTSRLETLSWVLSFGGEAELLKPEELRAELRERTITILSDHSYCQDT